VDSSKFTQDIDSWMAGLSPRPSAITYSNALAIVNGLHKLGVQPTPGDIAELNAAIAKEFPDRTPRVEVYGRRLRFVYPLR